MKNMLLRDDESSLKKNFLSGPDFTVLNGGEFPADPHTEDLTSKTSINVNFSDHEMVILGT
jgi:phosphoenolpyruvate carboxykinase (ATP)